MNNVLTIIGCHTNSNLKVNGLLHSLKYFMEISNTIAIVNSEEFRQLNLEEKIKQAYCNKNIIFNDILTDELCYIYKTKHADLSTFSNDRLRKHWIQYGKAEKRSFYFPVFNIYFDYKQNDKFIAHGKWLQFLNKIDYKTFDNVILTNDSFIVTRSLLDLTGLIQPNKELVSLLESNQVKYHYPDFLRIYNQKGLNKIIKYYNENMHKITDIQSVIIVYEVNSSDIFTDVSVLYKNQGFDGNIHFDDIQLQHYLYNKNYPVVKIKKLISNIYFSKNIPKDFNPSEYKSLHPDLNKMTDNAALNHFKEYGINEGRIYKKHQKTTPPIFLKHYMNLIGFYSN